MIVTWPLPGINPVSYTHLDEAQLRSRIWEANVKTASDLALNYLTYRSRTKKQLYDYLKRKGFEESALEEVIRRMEEYRFLDDGEFARRWVQSKKTGKPVGRRKIAYELKSKGIAQDVLCLLYTSSDIGGVDERLPYPKLLQEIREGNITHLMSTDRVIVGLRKGSSIPVESLSLIHI